MSWSAPDARPAATPVLPAYAGERPSTWRPDLVHAGFVAAVTVLLGAPMGLLWSALAPHAHVQVDASGANVVDGATEVFIAGDGWFLGLTLVAGLVVGVLSWLVARRSGPYVVVALALGGLAAAYVASKVGVRLGQDALTQAVRSGTAGRYTANVALQMKQAVLVWPIAAMAGYVIPLLAKVDEIRR
jgi:hypothetical protein